MSCEGFEHVRTATFEVEYVDPTKALLFDDFTASFRIASKEGDSPLLAVSQNATPNGSSTVCSGQTVVVKIEVADLMALPLSPDPSEPWAGWFEADFTSPDGTVTSLDRGCFLLHRGI